MLSLNCLWFSKKIENYLTTNQEEGKNKTNALWFKVTHQLFIIDKKKEEEKNTVLFCKFSNYIISATEKREKNTVLFSKFSNCIISATERPIDLF